MLKRHPKVSIIMTLYNIQLKYVQASLQSLLAQTYKNIEILVVDDASDVVKYDGHLPKSARIKYIRNSKNIGMCKSVNKMFKLASGKYVVRLGSDDLFYSGMIERYVEFMENNEHIGAVCCWLQAFGMANYIIKRPTFNLDRMLYGTIKQLAGTGYAGGMLFRKKLLKHCAIDEDIHVCEDFDFHCQLAKLMPITSIPETMYFYRKHEDSMTAGTTREQRERIIKMIQRKHRGTYDKRRYTKSKRS